MALSNLALFGGAFFTPVNTCNLLSNVYDGTLTFLQVIVGKITHTIGLSYVMATSTSEPMLTSVINRLAMVLLFNRNLCRGSISAHPFLCSGNIVSKRQFI